MITGIWFRMGLWQDMPDEDQPWYFAPFMAVSADTFVMADFIALTAPEIRRDVSRSDKLEIASPFDRDCSKPEYHIEKARAEKVLHKAGFEHIPEDFQHTWAADPTAGHVRPGVDRVEVKFVQGPAAPGNVVLLARSNRHTPAWLKKRCGGDIRHVTFVWSMWDGYWKDDKHIRPPCERYGVQPVHLHAVRRSTFRTTATSRSLPFLPRPG